jgi:hypothetical protein
MIEQHTNVIEVNQLAPEVPGIVLRHYIDDYYSTAHCILNGKLPPILYLSQAFRDIAYANWNSLYLSMDEAVLVKFYRKTIDQDLDLQSAILY